MIYYKLVNSKQLGGSQVVIDPLKRLKGAITPADIEHELGALTNIISHILDVEEGGEGG